MICVDNRSTDYCPLTVRIGFQGRRIKILLVIFDSIGLLNHDTDGCVPSLSLVNGDYVSDCVRDDSDKRMKFRARSNCVTVL